MSLINTDWNPTPKDLTVFSLLSHIAFIQQPHSNTHSQIKPTLTCLQKYECSKNEEKAIYELGPTGFPFERFVML